MEVIIQPIQIGNRYAEIDLMYCKVIGYWDNFLRATFAIRLFQILKVKSIYSDH
jgi:hypothetical protein